MVRIPSWEKSLASTDYVDEYVRLMTDLEDSPTPANKIYINARRDVLWKCIKEDCLFEWKSRLDSRAKGKGCLQCLKTPTFIQSLASMPYVDEYVRKFSDFEDKRTPPNKIFINSHDFAYWKCVTCLHEWESDFHSRNYRKMCPECVKIPDFDNSLASANYINEYMGLEKDALEHITPPERMFLASAVIARWKCIKCSHEWKSPICYRKQSSSCPNCIGKIINSENCLSSKSFSKDYIRLINDDENFPTHPDKIFANSETRAIWECVECKYSWKVSVSKRNRGSGCVKCSRFKEINYEQSLASMPYANEYVRLLTDSEDKITPIEKISIYSNRIVLWKCLTCGYEWKKSPSHRTKISCISCSGSLLTFNKSLASRGGISEEFLHLDSEILSVNKTSADKIAAFNNNLAWWKCYKCSYIWQARINSRSRSCLVGCKNCSGSHFEYLTSTILKKLDLNFDIQYKLPIIKITGNISIDFVIYHNNILKLIECDGAQHFISNNFFHKNKKDFEDQIKRDIKTNKYCWINKIPLLRIDYKNIKNIEKIIVDFLKRDEILIVSNIDIYKNVWNQEFIKETVESFK